MQSISGVRTRSSRGGGVGGNGFFSISIVIKGFLSSNYVCIVLYIYIYIQVCIIDGIISVIAHTMYILSAKSCITYIIFFLAVVTPNHNYHSTYISYIPPKVLIPLSFLRPGKKDLTFSMYP